MKLGRQWEERFRIWDEAFAPNLYQKLGTLGLSGFTTFEALEPERVVKQKQTAFPVGKSWGAKWEYGWFHARLTTPGEAAGKRLMLHIGAGPEMLVFVDGQEAGSIDKKHSLVEVAAHAVPGRVYDIWAEVYAGHGPRLENGGVYTREDIPVPEPAAAQCTVQESHFGIWREELFAAYADYHTLYELWKTLPETQLRCMQIGKALQEFTCTADFEAEEPERTESILEAAKALRPLLDRHNSETAPDYTVFGQSHLDLAWLWTLDETRRKSARTYSNQLALLKRYPDYRFLVCEPPILENLKNHYPQLYRRVCGQIKEGRLIPEGAVYVESDTNMAGAESLVRQFVYGKRWFSEELGVDSRMAWMPDTFGFSGALPQIMAGCRVPYFATQKLLRCDPECEQFPYNVFWWEGIDGTRILSHIYKKNNAVFTAGALRERWENDRNQKEEIDGLMFPFGYGDGGGGPTELMVETAKRCEDLEGAPRCHMESPVAFFERLSAKEVRNVYYGELYLAWHRGTYTAQAAIKRGVRRAEYALREAEYLAGLLRLCADGQKPEAEKEEQLLQKLEQLWKSLLLQEFHDILPGTSIQRVNEETREALAQIEDDSRQLAKQLLDRLTGGKPACFNSLSWERSYRGVRLPACGYRLVQTACEDKQPEQSDPFPGSQLIFTNGFYRAELDHLGRLISLTDRRTGYEYAKAPLNDWRLYRDVNVDYDAWELGRMYEAVEEPLQGESSFLAERDAQGGVVATVERREKHFTVRQEIHFATDSPRIDFRTEVDWHERHRLLKVDFPTTVYTKEVLQEIQFGYIKRPTHRSRQYEKDLYETCHHKYAVLTDGENGFALLNDCKYGMSAEDSRLSLTLLRAPVIPDMTADHGKHSFTYSILPFDGPFTKSRVVEEAYECNVSVTESGGVCEENKKADRGGTVSFFGLEGGHAVLETCKPAFDAENGVVLRLYESKGCASQTTLTVPAAVKEIFSCNMLEEKQEKLPLSAQKVKLQFRPFEIKTLLLMV